MKKHRTPKPTSAKPLSPENNGATQGLAKPPKPSSRWRLPILIAVLFAVAFFAWRQSSYRQRFQSIETNLAAFENPKALEEIRSLETTFGKSAQLHLLAARAHRQADEHQAFIKEIELAKQLGATPKKIDAEVLLDQVQSGRLKDSPTAIGKWLEDHPEDFESGARALVLGLFKQQDFDAAIAFLTAWEAQNPNSPAIPLLRSMLHISKREWKLALNQLEPALEKHPTYVPLYLQAATAYDGEQNFPQAEKALERYLQSIPKDLDAWLKYSEVLRKLGKSSIALDLLYKHVPPESRTASLQLQLAKLLLDSDHLQPTIDSLSRLSQLWPEDIEIASTMSQAYQRLGDDLQAKRYAQIAQDGQQATGEVDRLLFELLNNPNRSAENCFRLGHILLHKQSRENGLYWLSAALQINPNYEPAKQDLALYYQRVKQPFADPRDTSAPTKKSTPKPSATATAEPNTNKLSTLRFREIQTEIPNTVFLDGSEQNFFSLVETTGGGSALIDFDSDGQLDVLCATGGSIDIPNKKLPGNRGALMRHVGNFQFLPATAQACIDLSASYNSAIIAGDYDNDGFTDFLATGYHGTQWFHNQGDGTFESVPMLEESTWSSSAAFADLDSDGDLDLYVVHYANWSFDNHPSCPSQNDPNQRDYCGPSDFEGLLDSVYENTGDGKFIPHTPEGFSTTPLRGLGVLAADLDGDRRTDLYITNDVEPNLLYKNEGPFEWTEMARRAGVATNDQGRAEGSMGISLGDYNNDARFDLWVTNYADEFCALYRASGPMSFSYASNAARIPATDEQSVSWGTAFHDLDLDGDEDIVVINGHLERFAKYHDQRPQILENYEANRFALSALDSPFFQSPIEGRGLATGDFDRDGLVDLAVTRIGAPLAIVRNESTASNTTAVDKSSANTIAVNSQSDKVDGQALRVRLIGTLSNRDAIGTVAKLSIGDRTWIRQCISGSSYASTSENVLHFGIPPSSLGKPATLQILWPSGQDSLINVEQLHSEILVIENSELHSTQPLKKSNP